MMNWKIYHTLAQAAADIADKQVTNVDHAVPDVYGKAIQLYFALLDAYNRHAYCSDDVQMWRGLITLLALQDHLSLPLSWQKVTMPGSTGNQFDEALLLPPDNPERRLFKDKPWNGVDFYVLTWTLENGREIDLLLYSPYTLVYPVADWRDIFADLRDVKWYDAGKKCFCPPETVLNEHEKEIVLFWLDEAAQYFNSLTPTDAQGIIRAHLDEYMADLKVVMNAQSRAWFKTIEINGDDAGPGKLFDHLKQTVRAVLPLPADICSEPIPTNQIFSDQICYFRMKYNPFGACLCPEGYRIKKRTNWYAFLPVHPHLRAICGQNKPIETVFMQAEEKNGEEGIRAVLTVAGKKYEKIYRIVKEATAESGLAVPYEADETDIKTAPLISVWPNTIGEAWKTYYIMLQGGKYKSGTLEIAEIPDLGDEYKGVQYTVKADCTPYAIPIAMRLPGHDDTASVGIVIPALKKSSVGAANIEATVAVDFGTSSTMIFAQVNGQEIPINIEEDHPLLVTACDPSRAYLMRDYFIPPAGFSRGTGSLSSVYRRSTEKVTAKAKPILDGVIYQSGSSGGAYMVKMAEDANYLMSNLKWQVRTQKTYYIAFMKQLVLHITSLLYQKGVTSINWRYALPESMAPGNQKSVNSIWTDELIPYLEESVEGITHRIISDLTESEAASRYFLFQQRGPVHPGIGYLVVDIGGGSTDIALWQGTPPRAQMKWHTSVEVAGRKMFTRWVSEVIPSLCAGVVNETWEASIDLIKKAQTADAKDSLTEDVKDSLVEILLNANSTALLENYRQECRDHADGWGQQLYVQISRGVSLLMFALGYQIGGLMAKKAFSIPDEEGAFVIAFGGKGAKMLDWIESVDDNDTGSRDGRLKEMFRSGIKAAAGGTAPNINLQIEISEVPKCEVARGLLLNRPPEASDAKQSAGISMNTEKYIDGAQKFRDAFGMYFSGKPQTLQSETIVAELVKNGEHIDEIVKVFMEIVYEYMA